MSHYQYPFDLRVSFWGAVTPLHFDRNSSESVTRIKYNRKTHGSETPLYWICYDDPDYRTSALHVAVDR